MAESVFLAEHTIHAVQHSETYARGHVAREQVSLTTHTPLLPQSKIGPKLISSVAGCLLLWSPNRCTVGKRLRFCMGYSIQLVLVARKFCVSCK